MCEVVAIETTLEAIAAAEKALRFQQDAARNRLLRFEIVATSIGSAMSVGGVVSGIFGMNLQSPIFSAGDDGWIFLTVVGIIVVGVVGVMLCFLLLVWYGGSIRPSSRAAARPNRSSTAREESSGAAGCVPTSSGAPTRIAPMAPH